MEDKGAIAVLGLALVGLAGFGAFLLTATREAEEPPVTPPEEEIIDATLRSGYVYWAALIDWRRVYDRYPNEWPADTDITFAWLIKNTGNIGAYFQVYLFTPGEWLYLEPNDERQVFETFRTPAIPVTPGYQYYRINILGRKITGERIGAVWTSREIEVVYV